MEKVFGKIKPYEGEKGGVNWIGYYSLAIVEALEKIGAPVGSKVEQKYHVPEVIREGSEDVKKAYLYQTMMDEGSWTYDEKRGKMEEIYYAQSSALRKEELTEEKREYLDELCSHKKESSSGAVTSYVYITERLEEKLKEEHPHLWEIIKDSKPPFLEEEMDMLEEVTGVRLEFEPNQIYKTTSCDYRVSWKAWIGTYEDIEKIINGLGLPVRKHRKKGEG